MKFIELTKHGGRKLHISPMLITVLEDIRDDKSYESQTIVHTMGGKECWVLDSVDDIKKKIADSEKITMVNWETGIK